MYISLNNNNQGQDLRALSLFKSHTAVCTVRIAMSGRSGIRGCRMSRFSGH